MSKLICPQCGAEVILPKESNLVTGVSLAENTDNNTYYLNTKENKNMGKVAERLETLKNNGIDVSKFFSVSLPNGDEVAMKMEYGIPVACNLDDYFDDDIDDEIESAKDYAETYLEYKVDKTKKQSEEFSAKYKAMAEDNIKHATFIHDVATMRVSEVSEVYTLPVDVL